MNWDDVGNAIQAAVARSSGVTTIWKDQNVNAPALDYVAIRLGSIESLGIDYLRTKQDLTRPRGEEFKLEVIGIREVPLEIECFTAFSVGGQNMAALSLCERTKNGLLLPSIRGLLKAQAVSPFDPGPTLWIPDIPSTKFRGRAVCTVRCYMRPPSFPEYVGYISRIRGTVYVHGTASGGSSGTAFTIDSNNG